MLTLLHYQMFCAFRQAAAQFFGDNSLPRRMHVFDMFPMASKNNRKDTGPHKTFPLIHDEATSVASRTQLGGTGGKGTVLQNIQVHLEHWEGGLSQV